MFIYHIIKSQSKVELEYTGSICEENTSCIILQLNVEKLKMYLNTGKTDRARNFKDTLVKSTVPQKHIRLIYKSGLCYLYLLLILTTFY